MKFCDLRLFSLVFIAAFLTVACGAKARMSDAGLPRDIMGISVGMNKNTAENRLKEIAKLIRTEEKRQEVWVLKEDKSFSHLAVGYDREDRVRYITAIAKLKDGAAVKPGDIGNLETAEKQAVGSNYRYTWQVAAQDQNPAYTILVQGNQPENLSLYTLSAANGHSDEEEEEEKERGEKNDKKEN